MAEVHPSRKINSPEIPPEILFYHILPRLPGRSVLRLQCVCKQWRSFLKTPTFVEMHHQQNHHKLLVICATTPCTFRTIDCESPDDGVSAARPLPFKAKHENITIVASSDGLVCVGIKRMRDDDTDHYSDLILWNPLTGEYKTLSRANSNEECYMSTGRAFGLYHSSSNDDYKLLRVTDNRDVYIYSLKSDSWSKVESPQEDFKCIPPFYVSESWHPGVLLNEKLYFVKQLVKRGTSPPSYSIISFDTKTEKFSEIAAPSFGNPRTWWLNLMVIRGRIHLSVTYCIQNANPRGFRGAIEMWRMDGDGDGDGDWRKVVSCVLPSSFPWNEQPLHVMKNGNWLMYSGKKGYVYKVDLKKRTNDQVCSYIGMDILAQGKYIETFVSLKRYV